MNYALGAIGLVFTILYAYQVIYAIVGLLFKPKIYTEGKNHRFAVLISARNEETVIENLLNSIKAQTYPSELVDIYVVADNCTDKTAELCRACGVNVYERFNKEKVGKGYALDYLFSEIFAKNGEDYYDGYFVFDADNLLEPDYIEQMNYTFSAGYRIVTSYRNSKNYGSNWISAGYALWFLREAKYVSNARMILGTSCAISGTGFLVHRDIIKRQGGWKHFLLTEDIEFSADNIIKGEKIGYCHTAMLYDEQPETFRVSWNQRLRWAKGFLQVFRHYGAKLIGGIFTKKLKDKFSCYDMAITVLPIIVLTIAVFVLYVGLIIKSIVQNDPELWNLIWKAAFEVCGFGGYGTFFMMGLLTVITEWRYINCTNIKKIVYLFTFPLYMFTWVPIGIVALFKKVEWTPIKHTVVKNIEDVKSSK